MAKRLNRYYTFEMMEQALPLLVGKKINIVTRDGRVFYGILDKFENGMLYYRNMRLKKQKFPIMNIAEVIYDH